MELELADVEQNPAVAAFIAELRHWREVNGCSQKKLASLVGYTPSYVNKVEHGTLLASKVFAEAADQHLQAGRAIIRRWKDMHEALVELSDSRSSHAGTSEDAEPPPAPALVIEHEQSELVLRDGMYRTRIRRQLRNIGHQPVTQYLIRIVVDRYPGDPGRSNQLYRHDPLIWEEISLSATCGDEPMVWRVKHDRDAAKEVWLLFENIDGKFPLYPGETTWISYQYTVPAHKWGPWWSRAMRASDATRQRRWVTRWMISVSVSVARGPLRPLIDAMITTDPGLSTGQIWQRLLDEHDADISLLTVRDYLIRRQAFPPPQPHPGQAK